MKRRCERTAKRYVAGGRRALIEEAAGSRAAGSGAGGSQGEGGGDDSDGEGDGPANGIGLGGGRVRYPGPHRRPLFGLFGRDFEA